MQAVLTQSKLEDGKISEIPKAVVSWLTFQKAVQMSHHIREDALSFPIVTLLAQTGWEIRREQAHPLSNTKTGRGRDEQIDFVCKRRLSAETVGSWAIAIETKIFDQENSKTIWDRVVMDLIRLDSLADYQISKMAKRLFLGVCPIGKSNTSIARFINSSAPPILNADRWPGGTKYNFFEAILPWSNTGSLKVSELDKKYPKVYKRLKESGRSLPGYINISLVSMDWSDDFVCGLWKLSR